jgi:hypothetical protein
LLARETPGELMLIDDHLRAETCVWRIATYCQAQQFAHTRTAQKHLQSLKRPD